uniref:Striatin interacting protein 2 n=1 Tax=Macrostomum lignano TaxID=282301 RepID=A0A1I8IJR0_9PLAT
SSTAASEATSSSSSSASVSAAAAAAAAVAASDPQSGDEAAPGAAAAAPAQDLEFVYADADEYSVEIAELYTYTEEADLRANQVAFDQLFDEFHQHDEQKQQQQHRWTKLDDPSRRAFIERLLNMLDLGGSGVGSEDRRKRLSAVRALLYIAQGNWGECDLEEDQLRWTLHNAHLLLSGSAGGQSGPGGSGSNITLNDSTELRLMLSLLYILVETARCFPHGDHAEGWAKAREHLIQELQEPIVGEDCLAILLFNMVTKFCSSAAPHYPMRKVLLLLWKVVLLTLGPLPELHKRKNELRERHGLAPVTEETATVCGRMRASSPPMSAADMFDQMPRRRASRKSLAPKDPVAAPIHESVKVLRQNLYVSLAEMQMRQERDIVSYPLTKGRAEVIPDTPAEHLYRQMMPHIPQYMIALLKVLLAAAPTSKPKTETINLASDLLPAADGMPQTLVQSLRLSVDVNRHKEVIVKAISALLLLLLKHFKVNHVYQFEYVSQHLVFANCIPLVLKFFNQNILSYVESKNNISQLDFPACVVRSGEDSMLTSSGAGSGAVSAVSAMSEAEALAQEPSFPGDFCWRNLFSCVNLLRVLNKLTKWKHSRTMMLVVFKSAPILKRALKVRNPLLQVYALKLIKAQTKYMGRQWRKINMTTMSAIYEKVRHRLTDDWAFANDLDARPWDFQAEECSLRSAVDRFNQRRYSATGPAATLPDTLAPVDNNVSSVLSTQVTLTDHFKRNYQHWLEQEVFSAPINWDLVLSSMRT